MARRRLPRPRRPLHDAEREARRGAGRCRSGAAARVAAWVRRVAGRPGRHGACPRPSHRSASRPHACAPSLNGGSLIPCARLPPRQGVVRSGVDFENDPRAVTRERFPLPTLGPLLERVRNEVARGRGFALIRGFPVERYSRRETMIGYWGLGLYWGKAITTNGKGHLIGHIKVGRGPARGFAGTRWCWLASVAGAPAPKEHARIPAYTFPPCLHL